MKTSFISTYAIGSAARQTIASSQVRLDRAQGELASGRHYDLGRELGAAYGDAVSLRQRLTEAAGLQAANAHVATGLDVKQNALRSIGDAAQDFVADLLSVGQLNTGGRNIESSGRQYLQGLIDRLNTSHDGAFVFGGVNSGQQPIAQFYGDAGSPAATALTNTFVASFGFAPGSPGSDTITEAAMEAFLDGPFAALFDDAAWGADWSSASDEVALVRISANESAEVSVSANEGGLRKLAMAYAAAAELGAANLNSSTFQTMTTKLAKIAGEAVQEVSFLQARLGTVQERVEKSQSLLMAQDDVFGRRLAELESVDPFEVSVRVTNLLTQIETSYAVTARIQRLSLLNYL